MRSHLRQDTIFLIFFIANKFLVQDWNKIKSLLRFFPILGITFGKLAFLLTVLVIIWEGSGLSAEPQHCSLVQMCFVLPAADVAHADACLWDVCAAATQTEWGSQLWDRECLCYPISTPLLTAPTHCPKSGDTEHLTQAFFIHKLVPKVKQVLI